MNLANNPLEKIRNAQAADYKQAAPLIIQAMEDLACFFTQSKDSALAIPLFEFFFQQKHNQYSYENTLVYEVDQKVAGTLTAYNGARLSELRQGFLDYIEREYRVLNFHPENETEAGEYYIDTIGVSPAFQGQGIGSKLIQACMKRAAELGHKRVGLLVDVENPKAKKLYQRLGFHSKGIKEFMGEKYEHMQVEL